MRILPLNSLLIIVLILTAFQSNAQLTVIIESVPSTTAETDTLFLAGSFNAWNPHDLNFSFKPADAERHVFDFLTPMPDFTYKVTRGSWETVEGGRMGQAVNNREYVNKGIEKDTVLLEIASWEDQREMLPYRDLVEVKILKLPENTPEDASLFIVGSFNGWSPADSNFHLKRSEDGVFSVKIPIRSDTTEFKFSRGSWNSIEGRKNGFARQNRRYIYDAAHPDLSIEAEIESWEDLSSFPLSLYALILLLAVVQGILLIVAISTLQDNNLRANQILSLIILVISIAFLARLSAFDREVFHRLPKIILVPDFIYFLYGPLFLIYIQRLLSLPRGNRWKQGLFFVVFVIQLLVYSPLLLADAETFTSKVVDLSYKPIFILFGGLGWAFSSFFWWKSRSLIRQYQQDSEYSYSFDQNLYFLNTVLNIFALCLLVWGVTYLIGAIGLLLRLELTFLTDKLTDAIWVLAALTVYAMGYFAMRQPAIFKLPKIEKEVPAAQEESPVPDHLTNKISRLMDTEKPFLNPRLSLAELAELSEMHTHTLSKLINEGFGQNFFDFVNAYRIEEFKKRALSDLKNQQTLLSIALEVGFNSKTAFNRAFKKHTGQTPREFLKNAS